MASAIQTIEKPTSCVRENGSSIHEHAEDELHRRPDVLQDADHRQRHAADRRRKKQQRHGRDEAAADHQRVARGAGPQEGALPGLMQDRQIDERQRDTRIAVSSVSPSSGSSGAFFLARP